ncbi:hypothetical protein LO772_31690 [Yinghuangia sp. ASG 101]|uniref:WD40 repeat domain-containing protein n=1 Tax=Yinghuangia sp. ASG 101 TaxID=2896848 RepID=UPI001E5C4FBB|nr:hypothetical protein [Yinghuangia sp. ASG 101]UGQ11311.1 hypothetical protein LO772_31690 [Yinghuangia sp. ASG 101]
MTVGHKAVVVGAKYINDTVRVGDMATGAEKRVLDQKATAVATTILDGRPTVSLDGTMRFWGLADGRRLGEPLACHSDDIATAVLHSRPVAVTGGGPDNALLIWDLATRTTVGGPLTGHSLRAVEVAATVGRDNAMLLWDITPAGPMVTAPSTGAPSRSAWRVDWATGSGLREGTPLSFPRKTCQALAAGNLDGRAVVVAGGRDGTLQVLNPVTGDRSGGEPAAHKGAVNALALTVHDEPSHRRHGGGDGTVRAGMTRSSCRTWVR